MRRLEWLSELGYTTVLTIEDGEVDITPITPGASPFVTQMDDDKDLFAPIRTQTGNIGVVVDSVDELTELIGAQPLDREVLLTVNGTVAWKGFLSCETFSQAWDKGPLDISIPVISPLEACKGVYPDNELGNLQYISFASFLVKMNEDLGDAFVSFVFPLLTEPAITLAYQFCMMNYAEKDSESSTGFTVKSYYDILEDICKLFGWQAQERGDALIFLAADTTDVVTVSGQPCNHLQFTLEELTDYADGQEVTGTYMTWEGAEAEIWGSEHDEEFLAGKKKVTVVGSLNVHDANVYSLNMDEGEYVGDTSKEGDDRLIYYNRQKELPSGIEVHGNLHQNNDIKFLNTDENNAYYGGCVACERLYQWTNQDGYTTFDGDSSLVNRLIVHSTTAITYLTLAATIDTGYYWEEAAISGSESQLGVTGFLLLSASIEVASTSWERFSAPADFRTLAAIRMVDDDGTTYYYSDAGLVPSWGDGMDTIELRYINGNLVYHDKVVNDAFPIWIGGIFTNGKKGRIYIDIYAPDYTDDSHGGTQYVAYKDIRLQVCRSRYEIALDTYPLNEYKSKMNIDGGWTDEWSQECGLTIARAWDVPYSLGAVLDAERLFPSSLYGGDYPEDALAARARDYYEQSRVRIGAIVKGGTQLLDPTRYYQLTNASEHYICLAQSVDWGSNEVKAWMFEPSY